MRVWLMRLLGIAIALIGAYLGFLAVHQSAIAALCFGGAAALAMLAVVLLWTRPTIGAALAAIFLVGGITARMLVLPRNTGADAQRSTSATSTSIAEPARGGGGAQARPPTTDVSSTQASGGSSANEAMVLADRPLGTGGTDVSILIGPTVVDDGVATVSPGQAVAAAGNAILSAFDRTATAPPPNSTARFGDVQRTLPSSEYDLSALSATLPSDAAQLDVFVRDNIALDPYSGILRGALGTWMTRAGGPDDKVVLLSMLLAKHNIDYAIVRGTLSAADQAALLAAAAARPVPALSDDSVSTTAQRQADAVMTAGGSLASAVQAQLRVPPTRQTAFGPTHYWIHVKSGNAIIDLDPSLPSLQPGAHVGTLDAGYKAGPFVPADAWYALQFRVVGIGRDESRTIYLTSTQRSADLQDVPVGLLIAPVGDVNAIAGARTFQTRIRVGSHVTTGKPITLDGASAPAAVFIEVRTRTPQGEIQAHRYRLFDGSTAAADVRWRLAGTHTYVVENGTVNETFALNELLKSLRNYGRATDAGDSKKLSLYPMLPLSFLARDDALAASAARRSNLLLVRTAPSIVAVHAWNAPDGSTLTAFDIVSATRDSASSARAAVVASNLARASGDAAIEARLIGTPKANMPALFDPARGSRIALQSVTPAVARDEMTTSLANGDIVLAPAGGGTPAVWWEIDPKTGSAVARASGGGGQEFAEEDIDYAEIYEQAWLVNAVGKTAYQCAKSGPGSLGCKVAMCGMTVEVMFSVLGKPGFSMARFASDIGKDLSADKLCELEMGAGGGEN